jgi:hypothetical protein
MLGIYTETVYGCFMITPAAVRAIIDRDREKYRAEMKPPASPPTWNPSPRSVDLYACFTWMRHYLEDKGCPDDIRIRCQDYFSRKSRATEDLFELVAKTLNDYEEGTVEDYRGR